MEYIVNIHFICPYPNLLTLYVQYTKTLSLNKYLNLLTLYVPYTKTLAVKN